MAVVFFGQLLAQAVSFGLDGGQCFLELFVFVFDDTAFFFQAVQFALLAIALVIFTIWRPNVSVLASILFGGLYILYLYIPTGAQMAVKELYKMLPYVVTVVVLVISSLRNNKEKQPPASLGLSYFREER